MRCGDERRGVSQSPALSLKDSGLTSGSRHGHELTCAMEAVRGLECWGWYECHSSIQRREGQRGVL